MPSIDMPLEELVRYCPPRAEPGDFDEFWAGTLAETRAHALAPLFDPVDSALALVHVFDVTFSGFGGDRITPRRLHHRRHDPRRRRPNRRLTHDTTAVACGPLGLPAPGR